MSRVLRACLPLTIGLLVLGCGPSEPAVSPSDAIHDFYRHLNDGAYGKAMALYSSEARKVLEDPDAASEDAFAQWAKAETKDGTVDHVEVTNERAGEESATIEYQVRYTDGSRALHTVTLTFEEGGWKLGLIG